MASFFKKLVESRSKSPQKREVGKSANENLVHRETIPPFAPVCYLPLPPSPVLYHSKKNGSSHSNDSFGIHSWNTEPREVDDWFSNISKGRSEVANHPGPLMRARSHSPRKLRRDNDRVKVKSKSKSPQKDGGGTVINQLNYLNSQCHLEGCRVDIIVHSTRFMLCRHQLCHASLFFKNLLSKESNKEIYVSVSTMANPPPSTQFRWFVETSVPCPALKDLTDEILETCMRLSRKFEARELELRCVKYLIENCCNRQPIVTLCWLNWTIKHGFDIQTQLAILPSVARLSLNALERHRNMITDNIYADLVTAKLRGTYDKIVQVFLAIHKIDHFSVDSQVCPRCKRCKEGMKMKLHCDPCRKQIGCDRCYQDGCDIASRSMEDMQAFFKCPHGLNPLNDDTDDCRCQITLMEQYLGQRTRHRFHESNDDYLVPTEQTYVFKNGK